MTTVHEPDVGDLHDLDRFVLAQIGVYEGALAEMEEGKKRSHWMWFVFPQIAGLGQSEIAREYALSGLEEARAYLEHPVLGVRLIEIAQIVLHIEGSTARKIFGSPDDMKLHSSATLFAQVSGRSSVFHQLLERFFQGEPDERTIELLMEMQGGE